MKKISCNDIKVTYILKNKQYVDGLDGLSISFDAGKVNILLGENGCGKTTLFNCLAGILPYDGDIYFDDVDASSIPIKNRKVSYIQQTLSLYPKLTIFDNIAFPLKNMKLNPMEICERVYKVMEELEIAHLMNCLPKQISIGQVQKVLLAKALISKPHILILDEAFSNLDEANKKFIQRKITEYTRDNNVVTICIDHNLDDAVNFGDRFLIIDNHQVLFESDKNLDIRNQMGKYINDEKE